MIARRSEMATSINAAARHLEPVHKAWVEQTIIAMRLLLDQGRMGYRKFALKLAEVDERSAYAEHGDLYTFGINEFGLSRTRVQQLKHYGYFCQEWDVQYTTVYWPT